MDDIKTLGIDIETYSSIDLVKCGVYRYAEAEDFTILLFSYSVNYGPVRCVDFAMGEELPQNIYNALWNPGVEKTAYNAAFERTCIGKFYGQYCDPKQWSCTMVLALTCGLPGSLAQVGEALDLSEDQAKMKEGKALIRYFSVPCKPTKKNGMRTRNLPEDDPEKWAIYKAYNIRDVEVETTIRRRLLQWRPDRTEQRFWELDQRINDIGIKVDIGMAKNAVAIGNRYKESLLDEARDISGLSNPNSASQIKQWLEEQEDVEVLSLNKKEVIDIVANLKGEDTKKLMALREEFSKSSTSKYDAILRCACDDGRAHGLFQFYGAGRTGRFAGRQIQLQNLPQNHMEDLDSARYLVSTGDYETFVCLYDRPQAALSELIRTAVIPEEGHRFIVADFSAIEARVIAWIAGEQWRIDTFRNGGDIYCASASQAFKVPVEKHGVNSHLRQKGKVLELACIAEGQLVLTDIGLVPIEDVTTANKVWDGSEWVEHEGVVCRGEKDVIEYEGLTATTDHLVFIEGESEPLEFGIAASCGAHLVQTGDGRNAVRMGEDNIFGEAMEQELESLLCSYRMRGVRACFLDMSFELDSRSIQRLSELFGAAEESSDVARQETDGGEAEMREPKGPGVRELRRAWNSIRIQKCDGSWVIYDLSRQEQRYGDNEGFGIGSYRYQWRLRSRESSVGVPFIELLESETLCFITMGSEVLAVCTFSCDTKAVRWIYKRGDHRAGKGCGLRQEKELARYKGKARVYDIRNAGRHHRFTVSGKLVHNCGYGGGVGAMKNFGADKMGMSEEEMAHTVDLWRDASPHIVSLWSALDRAAKKCIATGKSTISDVGNTRFDMEDGVMWMNLPSGRRIAYWGACKGEDRWGRPSIAYMGLDQKTHKWAQLETFGGKLTENLIQATARDVLREAMFHLVEKGYDIRATVHDEVIITCPIGQGSLDEVIELMCIGAPWTEGLPLNAAGYECTSYRKD